MNRINTLTRKVPTAVVWVGGLLPLAWLIWSAVANTLGPDPVKEIEHSMGLWGLQFLIASLCVTPLRRAGLNLIRFRRALGVLAAIYVGLHFLTWALLDMGLRWDEILRDLYKRPYIILGMVGLLCLIPLVTTSTNRTIRWMGPVAWRRLHRLSYVAAVAGALHFVILVKGWQVEPLLYGATVIVLLSMRVAWLRPLAARV